MSHKKNTPITPTAASRVLTVVLAILMVVEPVTAQPPVTVTIASAPVSVNTYTAVVSNPTTVVTVSAGTLAANNVLPKPTVTQTPVIVPVSGASQRGSCGVPAQNIVQDCFLGNSSFEANMINLWLGIHGLPESDATFLYQYGGKDLRSQLRSFMLAYVMGVITEDPSLRSTDDQAVFNWMQTAIDNNEIAYYQAAVGSYNSWAQDPCEFQLNSTIASAYGLSYDGLDHCGNSIAAAFTTLAAPDISYFKEVGQVAAYDGKVAAYDPEMITATGSDLLLEAEGATYEWASLEGLGASLAIAGTTGLIVAANIKNITPFTFRSALNVESEDDVADSVDVSDAADITEGVEVGVDTVDVAGVIGIVAMFVQIGVEAIIDLVQDQQNQNAINQYISQGANVANQTQDLNAMMQDPAGYQKIAETFMAATLPDLLSQTYPTLPALPTGPASDVFYITNHTHPGTGVSGGFTYLTWDPQYPSISGPAPYATNNGATVTASAYGGIWLEESEFTPATGPAFLSTTIKYIDANNGIHYSADRIDSGRFLVVKAPDQIGNHDFDCPVDPAINLTSNTGMVPTECKSFVVNQLNVIAEDYSSVTVMAPQAPVFATPNGANFTIGQNVFFYPQIDSTSNGFPCTIRVSGALPPGFSFQNGALYIFEPFLAVPGTYNVTFIADCETLGSGAFTNYSFGTAMTTQLFTANVYAAASASLSSGARPETKEIGRTAVRPESMPVGNLQFTFPAANTTIALSQGRPTTLLITTNGGSGTTITAGANALPPGMTLTDNGNGTASVNGTPTGAGSSCSSGCAITASYPGLTDASLTLSYTVSAPALPSIASTQSVSWNAGANNITTIDGSMASSTVGTQVQLSWSAVSGLPAWATFTDDGNNIVTLSGTPPVAAAGQNFALTYHYSYGGGLFTSPTFTMNIGVNPPTPVLTASPSLLFESGVSGSGTINSSTYAGVTGLSGTWQVNSALPTGLTQTPGGTSLTISGIPANAGSYQIPVQFSDSAGQSTQRNISMLVTQPASLAQFPSRLVLFVGVAANYIFPVTAGYPTTPSGPRPDGLPASLGTGLAVTGPYPTTNGFTITSNGAALTFKGKPLASGVYPLTVSAQTQLSTGPVGPAVSQPFTLYIQAAGDVNLDGVVNCADYDLVKAHYNATLGSANYLDLADPNHDGIVNILDLAFVQAHLPKGTVCQ